MSQQSLIIEANKSTNPTQPNEKGLNITIIFIVVVVVLTLIIVILVIIYYYWKKKERYSHENKRNSSDGLVGSFTDRSPTNPPSSIENMYDKIAHALVMYAELSGFNRPHNKVEPQSSTMKQQDQPVVYSDVMIKGQPPPPPYELTEIRETHLHSSATPTKTVITHPDEDIQEIFFHHHDNDNA